jgi:tetratricopeptide (TPR) repeat protein
MSGRLSPTSLLTWLILLAVGVGCGGRGAREGPGAAARMNDDKTSAHDLLENGRFEDVVGILAPWAGKKVQDPQVYSMLAKAQWKLRNTDDAITNYEEAARLDYSNAYAHLELAQLLVEIGRPGRALTEFDLAIQYGGPDPLPRYNYGLALYGLNRREEALNQWRIAYSLDNRDPRYAEAMGIGLTGEDDKAALEYFERADSLGADQAEFHDNFGLLLQRLGDYGRAEAEFREAVAREPGNVFYRRNLALLYMVSGRLDAAVPVWETLLDEDKDSRVYRIYLARAYLGVGRFESAIGVLENWLQGVGATPPGTETGEAPPIDEAYDVLAMSYRGKKDLVQAASYVRKALELKPRSVGYLINYGVILAEDGKIAKAKTQWEKALEIDPNNPTARQNLSAYQR